MVGVTYLIKETKSWPPHSDNWDENPQRLLLPSLLPRIGHNIPFIYNYLSIGEEKYSTFLFGETFVPSSLGLHRSQFIYPLSIAGNNFY